MINSFKLIKLILVYFLVSRLLTALAIKFTGGFLLGTLIIEASILAIFLFYLTYHMRKGHHKIKIDLSIKLLIAVLFAAVAQGIFVAVNTKSSGLNFLVQSFTPFRRYFLPLPFFWIFNYLLALSFRESGDELFSKILRFFKIVLYIAIFYSFAEAFMRISPALNSFYANFFIAPIMNADSGTSDTFNKLSVLTKTYFPLGLKIKIIRVFGVCLDFFVSGSVIFLLYLYRALFAEKFKVFSAFNVAAFMAVMLTGTLQFIVPFLMFNLYIMFKRSKAAFWVKISGIIFLSLFVCGFFFRILDPERGYGTLLIKSLPFMAGNLKHFIFGIGAIRTNLDIGSIMSIHGALSIVMLDLIADIGIFVFILEVGLILFLLFLSFYGITLSTSNRLKNITIDQKAIINKLKLMLTFSLIVFISHYAILFSRVTYVFFLFLLSLLYSYSRYLKSQVGQVK